MSVRIIVIELLRLPLTLLLASNPLLLLQIQVLLQPLHYLNLQQLILLIKVIPLLQYLLILNQLHYLATSTLLLHPLPTLRRHLLLPPPLHLQDAY